MKHKEMTEEEKKIYAEIINTAYFIIIRSDFITEAINNFAETGVVDEAEIIEFIDDSLLELDGKFDEPYDTLAPYFGSSADVYKAITKDVFKLFKQDAIFKRKKKLK